jgi:predicted Holliday junction resolvase-like endonuclease
VLFTYISSLKTEIDNLKQEIRSYDQKFLIPLRTEHAVLLTKLKSQHSADILRHQHEKEELNKKIDEDHRRIEGIFTFNSSNH